MGMGMGGPSRVERWVGSAVRWCGTRSAQVGDTTRGQQWWSRKYRKKRNEDSVDALSRPTSATLLARVSWG